MSSNTSPYRAELKGVARKAKKEAVATAMKDAGLDGRELSIIGELSKGYRQRVGLADALVANPPLLILDEPTSGLDPNQIREVRDLVKRLSEAHTIVLSTHILSEVEQTCTRGLVISEGAGRALVASGTIDELRAMRGSREMRLVARAEPSVVEKVARDAKGVARISREDAGLSDSGGKAREIVTESRSAVAEGCTAFTVVFEEGADIAVSTEALVATLVGAKAGIVEVSPRAASLEQVFTELTLADAAAPPEKPKTKPKKKKARMRGFLAIYKREVFALFVTPLAWVLMTVFLATQGLQFWFVCRASAVEGGDVGEVGNPVQAYFGGTILTYLPLLFICPLLTMRLFAEERKSGTIEALLTAPVGTLAVVLGKYLGALTTYVALWLPTAIYILILTRYGEIDFRAVEAGYLGLFLIGASYLAIGTMTSALSTSQLIAAIVSGLVIVGLFTLSLGATIFSPGVMHDISNFVSPWSMMDELSRGLIDSRRLVYSAILVVLPLLLHVPNGGGVAMGVSDRPKPESDPPPKKSATDDDLLATPRGTDVATKVWASVSIAAALVLAVVVAILAARHYRRWDLSKRQDLHVERRNARGTLPHAAGAGEGDRAPR